MSDDQVILPTPPRRPRRSGPLPPPVGFESWQGWVQAGCPDLGPGGAAEPAEPAQRARSCGSPRPLLRVSQDSLWPAEQPQPKKRRTTRHA